mmetsp:Transcript_41729/g.134932  ORF Transcript_41729/g.134932 Transcript_41729/m.134932 type:complete len:221 (+) Transcript_41729:1-663(+)
MLEHSFCNAWHHTATHSRSLRASPRAMPELARTSRSRGLLLRLGGHLACPGRLCALEQRRRVQDLEDDLLERLLDALPRLRARLDEHHRVREGKLFPILPRHLLVGQIHLVRHQHDDCVLDGRILSDLVQPEFDVLEGPLLTAVVAQDDALSAPVVGRCECPESLLPCSVPQSQLQLFASDLHELGLEVNADGRGLLVVEFIIAEGQQDRRLTNTRVSDD